MIDMNIDTKSENFWAAIIVGVAFILVAALFFMRTATYADLDRSNRAGEEDAPSTPPGHTGMAIPGKGTVPFLEKR